MSTRVAFALRTTLGLALVFAAVASLPFLRASVKRTTPPAQTAFSASGAVASSTIGNGIIEPGEACDDGNLSNGDGCTSTGQIEQQCYDTGNNFSFFVWGDSYTSAGESGVKRLFADAANRTRYPNRLIPRFWISTGDIPFMDTSLDRLDILNRQISNTPGGAQNYPFPCAASNGQFPYFVAVGNHDVDGYIRLTPPTQYNYWSNYVGPKLPTTLVGIQNFTWGPDNGHDARTSYSFDYKNAHFIVLNQYYGDPTYPTADPIGCIRPALMDWIENDLANTDRELKFVFGHEPAWAYCSSLAGYGGSFCPAGHIDNLTPPYRPRPYSTTGDWTQPYGRHWQDSLGGTACPAGSRQAFWSMLGRHQVVAHIIGHEHTYYGRLVEANGTRRNDVHPYTKANPIFTTADGIWEVSTGQAHTSSGTLYVLVTVNNNQVTFETFDQRTNGQEPFLPVEKWRVAVGSPPQVEVTAPAAGATFSAPATIPVSADAVDSDGSVAQVAFFANGNPIGTAASQPFSTTWQNVAAGTYQLTAVATDNTGLTRTSAAVSITVGSGNAPPVLTPIGPKSVDEGTLLTVTSSATDADLPPQPLTYSLAAAPTGVAINATTGILTWTPAESDGPGTFPVTVRVTDSASATAETSFTITVNEVNTAPVLTPIGSRAVNEGELLTVNAAATDADLPAQTLTYSLISGPAGAAINASTGVFTWTPSPTHGAGNVLVTLRVTDSAMATADTAFTVTVTESNTAPVLTAIAAQTVAESALLTVAASASDSDVPAQTLTYSLVSGPPGAAINSSTGIFTWTPGESHGPGTFPVTIRVADSATATAETSFTITVTEVNAAPVFAAIGPQTVAESTALSLTASATDADLPAQTLTYSLVSAPSGAAINATTGAFTWTPGESDGSGSFPVTVRATDGTAPVETSFTITVTEANVAPVLAAIGPQTVAEGTLLSLTASATDSDLPAQTLTYSLVGGPAAASINPTSGVFSWTPAESDGPGSFPITIRVADGTATAERAFTITVTEVNAAPVFAAIGNQSVNEGTLLTVTAAATDSDLPAQTLTYSIVTAPSGAAISPAGVFTWTPGQSDGPGSFPVTIRVTDSATATTDTSFTITVTETNTAPVLEAIAARTIDEGTLLTLAAAATDADLPAQALAFSLVTPPPGASINPATGVFTWTPGESDGPGTFTVTIRVADSQDATAEVTFSITVNETNTAPALAAVTAPSVAEGTLLTIAAAATDSDLPPQSLTYSLVSAPTGAAMNSSSGAFTWTPGEAEGPGTFPVTVRVSDGAATADVTFSITVTESNVAPVLAAIANQSVNEGALLTVAAAATDADLPAQALTYSLITAPSGAAINPSTGVFTWTPGTSHGAGTVPVTIRVTDGTASDDVSFTITVTETNNAPVLAAIAAQSVAETTLLTVASSATDADMPGDTLTYSLVAAPTGAAINPTTGVFTWTPAEADGPGSFPVTIRVTDSVNASAETSFTITVTETNVAPVLAAIANQSVNEGALLTVAAAATDADLPAQALTYSLVAAPSGAAINPSTGVFTWTPSTSHGAGTVPVTIRVTDGTATADVSFTIAVSETNNAPVLAAIAPQSVAETTLLTVASSATDADLPGDTLTYSLVAAPGGAAINPTTGVFTWTPTEADGPGSFPVTIRVTDSANATAEASFTVTVTETNVAPVLAAIANQSVNEGALLTVNAAATDADLPAQTLAYSLVAAPSGAAINPSTGVFTWTPGTSHGAGTVPITIRVSDGTASDDVSFTITVTETNNAPLLAAIAAQSVAETTLLTVASSATDADLPGDALTYSLVAAPTGAAINPTTGVFTWTPAEADGPGSFPVTIRVTDSVNASAETNFTVTVTETNVAPVLAAIANQSVNEGALLTVNASATDADLPAQALTYSLVTAPSGAAINPSTGVFTWTPSTSHGAGTVPVTIRVTDGTASAEVSFTITVTETNNAPVLAAIAAQSVPETTLLSVASSATDADLPGDTLTYSLVAAPGGAAINPTTGVFTWTPTEADGPGSFPVTIRVTDSANATAEASFAVTVTETNVAPVLAAITNQSVNEGALLTVNASATDADLPAQSLTYSLVTAPSGAAIHPSTGVFTWTPSTSHGAGTVPVTIRVTDGTASADVSFSITVTETNNAPVLAAIAPQSVAETTLLTVASSATDADLPGDTLTYSLVAAPTGAAINPTTGVFTWTPAEADGPGSVPVTIRVTDSVSASAEASFTITVTETNVAPVLAAIANQSVNEGALLTVNASATDADLPTQSLTYSLVTAPSGAAINPSTGVFTWTPSTSHGAGTVPVTIRVTDGTASDDVSFNITVTETNNAPVLAAIAAQSVAETTLLTVASSATDADLPGDTLTYSLVAAPGGAAINPTTGVFTWTPTEADGPGSFPVTIRVTDSINASAETSFTVTVTETNVAPVLAAIANQSVNEGTLLTVTAAATDADLPAQALTYSLITAPSGAAINPTTGVFTWTPSTSHGAGTVPVTIRVTDGTATADVSFSITVTETNNAPVLAAIAAQSVAETTLLTVASSATDADQPGDTLTYSLVAAPSGAAISPTTGVFTWTPTEADGPGSFPVTIRVTDSVNASAETSFTITVTETNVAPVLAAIPNPSVNEGALLTVAAEATDADLPAQSLTYSLITAPSGAAINPSTGVFTWTPSTSHGAGTVPVTIRVSDGSASDDVSFTITVSETNNAPVLAAIAAQSVAETTLLTVASSATDADLPGDTLTYSLVAAPTGAAIHPTTGVFTWTPAEADGPGSFPVTIRVTDSVNASAETSFTITVTETNVAPVLAAIANQSVNEGALLTVNASATDADLPAQALTYSLVAAPSGAAINPSTGVFTWTPGTSHGAGTVPVTIRVTDGVASDDVSFTITVTETNNAPVLAAIAAQSVAETTLLTVASSATDADLPGDTLTYSLVAAPGGAVINPTTGVFTWTPTEADGPGSFPVTIRVTDSVNASAETSFTITVTETNVAPVLAAIANPSVNEGALLTVAAAATDADLPAQSLTYSLITAPSGAAINPSTGVFTWTPSTSHGAGTVPVTIRVTDGTATADVSFSITVTETNNAPVLAAIAPQSVAETTLLTVASSATDADLPGDTLTYSLVAAPGGAAINPTTGVFTWTPAEADGPGSFPVTIRVTDSVNASAEASFTITVTETNVAPVLAAIANQSVNEGALLTVNASATDADLPAQSLTYSLVAAPSGAAINPSTGVFTWTPSTSHGAGTVPVTIRVTDGTASDDVSFNITVTETNNAPVLAAIAAQSVAETTLLTVASSATDADLPGDTLTYSLVAAPGGAAINPTTGVFTWTPTEADGPGSFPVTIRVTDSINASAETSFTVTVTETNVAPVLAAIANRSVNEGALLTVAAAATDADLPAQALTYSLVAAPSGGAINPSTGVFTWTPSTSHGAGTVPVTIRVTDGTASDDVSFNITVTETNNAPVLAAIAPQSVAETTLLTVASSATDADLPGDTLAYSLVAAPTGAAINPTTGVFTWTPTEADGPGSFPVTIRVTDSVNATAEASFTITVTETNVAPVLAAIANQSVNEGALLTVNASATDADLPAQALTYNLVSAPSGAAINPSTGVFTWTPSTSHGAGTVPVTIRVSDGTASDDVSFTITVTETNNAPVLAAIAAQSVAETTLLTVASSATDADLPGDTLTYSLVAAPTGAAINPTTGVFTWTPTEADGPGSFPVIIRVTDSVNASAETSFTITVTETNVAPVLAAITNQSVNEGALLTVNAPATDADLPAQSLTYSLVTAPSGAAINPSTGVFTWTPSTSHGAGTVPVTIRVTDGTATADVSFTVTVTETNTAPVLAAIAAQSVAETTLLTVASSATDADLPGDTLTYSLVSAPTGAAMNPTTGVFTWTPTESDGPGSFPVTIRVTDSVNASAETSFTITVTETNVAPVLSAIANQSVNEGALLTVNASATDADLPAQALTYSLVTAPSGAAINPSTGVFTWTPSTSHGAGTVPVTIRVSDGTATADVSFSITVSETNTAPVLAPIANQSVAELTLLTVQASATDADVPAQTLTYSIVTGPAGSAINPATGAFTWTPTEGNGPGTFPVTIRVTDSESATADRSFTITVTETNTAPVLAAITARSVNEGTLLTVQASATDADLPAQTLTYSLVGAPAGATISATTGAFSWTPSETQGPGSFPVTVRVTDSGTATAETTFVVTVAEVNTAPALSAITNRTMTAGTLLTLTAAGTDADLPAQPLTYSLVTAPAGAAINPTTGVFTWTPTTAQTGTHSITISVADNWTPAASASRTFTVTVNSPSSPDLVLTALTTSATSVRAGTTFSASSTARNQGTATSTSFAVTFRLSTDPAYGGADDVVITATRSVSSLGVNSNSSGSTTLTVPASTPTGAYYVCAMADGNSTVNESNESNNTRCTTQTIQVSRPDLVLSTLQHSVTTLRRGDRFDVLNQVSNTGTVASPGSTLELRLSTNAVYGDADDIVLTLGTRSVGTLAAGASSSATTRPRVPLLAPLGVYFVCGSADAGQQVAEVNESNNTRCSATTLRIQ